MSNTKNVREKDEGHASTINVVLTTLKSTSVSTSAENGIRFQTSPLSLVGGGDGGTAKHQNVCCKRSFPSRSSYVLHLVEKAPNDVVHEMTLIEMGMLRCSVCSTWVHRDNMSLHLKKYHGVVKVTNNAKVVSSSSKLPASKNNSLEMPLKTGKSYVIKVSGKTLPTGKSFVVSCPSSKLTNSIDGTSVTSKPPMKLITTTSGSLYPKLHLQRGKNISDGSVVVQESLPNTSLPMVSFGSRVIMKSSLKTSGLKNGLPLAASNSKTLAPVTSANILQEGKTIYGVKTLQIDGSTLMASSSSGKFVNVSTATNGKEKQQFKPNQKSVPKGNKIVSKTENTKLKGTKKASVTLSSSNVNLVSSKNSQCETSTHEYTELDSSAKDAKFAALQLSFSEIQSENHAGKPKEAVIMKSNPHQGKFKPKSKGNVTDGKIQVGCKTSMANGNKAMPVKEHYLNDSVHKNEHLLNLNRSLILSDERSEHRETEGVKPAAGKKQRKQILKPVMEPEGDPNTDVPITSKVKVRKKKIKEMLHKCLDSAGLAKRNNVNPATYRRKCGRPPKEIKGDTFMSTPKTSHTSSRGGRGGLKKRGPGRPRKEEVVKPATPDSYEIDSLFRETDNEDIENEPCMVSRLREDDSVPTVELDLFTLPSLNEQISVFLTDPHNPDFKVYSSMDAIFVGDSALGDVTNQIGYVTDANNVVFVNPGHFLFPNIQEIDKFVPSPILTMKEKMSQSPKKLCRLSSNLNHTKVICLDKRLINADEGNKNKSSKRKVFVENQESPQNRKNCVALNNKGTIVKTPEKSRVRRHSARLSGDQDDAHEMPLKLKRDDLISMNKKTCKGALSNKLASKKLPLKFKLCSTSMGKDHQSLGSEGYAMGSGARELKVLISPLKLEHQSLVEEFLLESKKLPVKSRLALTFNDVTVNNCMEARKKLGAQIVSDDTPNCDTPETSAMCKPETYAKCKEETVCSRRQRTRTKSADSAYSVTSAALDPVGSDNCNDNYLSRRKGRLKSESEVLTNRKKIKSFDSAQNQRWGKQNCEDASHLLKTRLRHNSNVKELPEMTKTPSNLLRNNSDSDDNKHISLKKRDSSVKNIRHTQISEAVAEKSAESDFKESLGTLPENSLIQGKNWNITNKSSMSLHRIRPVRERRPSSKWLESLAYGSPFRKVPSPKPRTARSISDTTDQVKCEYFENKLGVDENGIFSISEPNQSNLDCNHEDSLGNTQGESGTKETASSISNETGMQQGVVENCSEVKENNEGNNQSMDSECLSILPPPKPNDIANNAYCKFPSNPSDKNLEVRCESTNRVPVEEEGACRPKKPDNMDIVASKQAATEAVIESHVIMSCSEISDVDGEGESIDSLKVEKILSVPDKEFKANKVSSNIKKRTRTKLILKKVEENFDEIMNKTGSISEDLVKSLPKNSTQTMFCNLSAKAKTPDVLGIDSPVVDSGLKKDGITNENDVAVGTNHVNVKCESNEGEVENKLETVDMKLDSENEAGKDDYKTVSKSRNIKLQDCENSGAKAALSENLNETVSCNVLKAIEGEYKLEEDGSNKLESVEVVDDQKSVKTILNEIPNKTVNSEWNGLLVTSSECHARTLPETSVKISKEVESTDVINLRKSNGSPIIDNASENTELGLEKDSSPLKESISRVSTLLIEVSESVKAEEKAESPQKFEGPRNPKKSGSSPRKGCLDISPPREWLGRGAKLKAQVLIQDQQTGVTDSHIVASNQTFSSEKEKSRSPKIEKLINSTSDTPVNLQASGGSSKIVKSPKSPRICCEEREWQARGAKLKAQVMITDQQTGHTNTRVETFESSQSPRSSLTSPRPKKMKFESPPGGMKDIRSFFTLCKSPEQVDTISENKSAILSLSPSPGQLSSPGLISSSKADLLNNGSFSNCSPKSISSSPRPCPQNSKRKKVKLYKVTSIDIRNFLTPARGTKRKIEPDAVLDGSKSVKIEKDISPFIKPEMEHGKKCMSSGKIFKTSKSIDSSTLDAWNIHPLQDSCSETPDMQDSCSETPDIKDYCPQQENCKMEKMSDSCKSVPEIPSVEFDFEGFKLSSRSSDLRAKSLFRIVSHLENKALYGLGNFPLPVDHLCDWNDDWLNIKIFDKNS